MAIDSVVDPSLSIDSSHSRGSRFLNKVKQRSDITIPIVGLAVCIPLLVYLTPKAREANYQRALQSDYPYCQGISSSPSASSLTPYDHMNLLHLVTGPNSHAPCDIVLKRYQFEILIPQNQPKH